jgi:hypothetical protein
MVDLIWNSLEASYAIGGGREKREKGSTLELACGSEIETRITGAAGVNVSSGIGLTLAGA